MRPRVLVLLVAMAMLGPWLATAAGASTAPQVETVLLFSDQQSVHDLGATRTRDGIVASWIAPVYGSDRSQIMISLREPASGSWSDPLAIDTGAEDVRYHVLLDRGRRHLLAVWVTDDRRLQVARLGPDGLLNEPRTIARTERWGPFILADADGTGNVAVLFNTDAPSRETIALKRPGERWATLPATPLEMGYASAITVGNDGVTYAARYGTRSLAALTWEQGSAEWRTEIVDADDDRFELDISLHTSESGATALGFTSSTSIEHTAHLQYREAGESVFGAPDRMWAGRRGAFGMSPDGRVVAVLGGTPARAVTRDPVTGVWSEPVDIDAAGLPSVSVRTDGSFVAAFDAYERRSMVRCTADLECEEPERFDGFGARQHQAALVAGPQGDAAVLASVGGTCEDCEQAKKIYASYLGVASGR